jgi:uncharacterized membrane protein
MFGFVIGALSLFGLAKVLRAGRGCGHARMQGWHGHGGWGHGGWGHHGWGRHGWGRHGWGHHDGSGHGEWARRDHGERSGRNAFGLRWVFERLDTTPGQEKVIRQAFDEVRGAMSSAQGELVASQREIAAAIRSGHVDEVQMGELYARQDEKLRALRTAFFGALSKVTEALDDDQRRALADMLDREQGGLFGGPYRN